MTTTTITGYDAIAAAEKLGLTLGKYADPTEPARTGLTVDEAREVASEDPGLVYIEVPALTDEQIERLEQEAGNAGDLEQAQLCRRALDGDTAARAECERAIRDAQAMAD